MWEVIFSAEVRLTHATKASEKNGILDELANSAGLKHEQTKTKEGKIRNYNLGKMQVHLHFLRNPSISMRVQDEALLPKANKLANMLLNQLHTRFDKSVKTTDVSLDFGTKAQKGANPTKGLMDGRALSKLNEKLRTSFSAVGLVLETKQDGWDILILIARTSSRQPYEIRVFSHSELSGGMKWDIIDQRTAMSAKLIKDLVNVFEEGSV